MAEQSKARQGRVGKHGTMRRTMHKAIQDKAQYRIRRKVLSIAGQGGRQDRADDRIRKGAGYSGR